MQATVVCRDHIIGETDLSVVLSDVDEKYHDEMGLDLSDLPIEELKQAAYVFFQCEKIQEATINDLGALEVAKVLALAMQEFWDNPPAPGETKEYQGESFTVTGPKKVDDK